MPPSPRSARTQVKPEWAQGSLFDERPSPGARSPRRSRGGGPARNKPLPAPLSTETGVVVAPDPLRERLESLSKEHARLLRDIAKKQARLNAAEELLREVNVALASQAEPIRERVLQHLLGIKQAFKTLLGPSSRLTRRDKTKVRRVCAELAETLGFEMESDDGATQGDLPPEDSWPPFGDHDDAHSHQPGGRNRHGGGYSAEKPSEANTSTLRALFRKLAIALHPDKVQDETAKAERTSVMKDVTRAYESGDLARLMELERSFLAQTPAEEEDGGLKRRCEQMLTTNGELRRQLRKLTSELKLVNFGQPVQVNLRTAKAREQAFAEIASVVQTFEREEERIAMLHEFVKSFAAGQMSVTDFLAGPAVAEGDLQEFEELLCDDDELFAEVLEELFRQNTKSAKRKRGR